MNTSPINTLDTDTADVLAAVKGMTAAFHRGDIERVMASYEPGATVVFEPGQPVRDGAQIRAMFEATFQLNPQFDYSGHEVVVAGDTATHFAPWTMRATTPDGTKVQQQGLSVAVLRRQDDGRWLMVVDNPHGQRLIDSAGYP